MPEQQGATHVEGRVIEPQPNAMFTVELENGARVLAHVAQEIRLSVRHFAGRQGPFGAVPSMTYRGGGSPAAAVDPRGGGV